MLTLTWNGGTRRLVGRNYDDWAEQAETDRLFSNREMLVEILRELGGKTLSGLKHYLSLLLLPALAV
jgi:hypothetical protein